MCGRFAITLPDDAMAQLFAAMPANDLPPVPRFNVCPTTQIAGISSLEGQRRLIPFRWGFIPRWYKSPGDGPLLINARAETIAEKRAFRTSARTRRCIIPASGFYEWTRLPTGEKLPWYITRSDRQVMAFAGIWREWTNDAGEAIRSAAMVTTAAGPDMEHIHHRQPVILGPDDWPLWLGEAGKGAASLMHAGPKAELQAHRVARDVNSNRASGPDLIKPIDC